jgi:UDP:flavonoid glycosyltransferase YjiC (YdhE family)
MRDRIDKRKFLFTTIPSNDLGLLTRSLPVASELAKRGHQVVFCSPGPAPSRLIVEAGFDNLLPKHPLYHLMTGKPSFRGLYRIIKSKQFKQDFGNLFNFLSQLIQTMPTAFPPITSEVWNMDHLGALVGMLNERFVRATCDALKEMMTDYGADVIVDAMNPYACVAARAIQKPLVTLLQADMHPNSQGFIWWKEPPTDIPTPVPIVNKVLAEYNLGPISKTEELCVGDLTLVMGTPETDPLPEKADVTYIGPILWQNPEAKLPDWINDLSQEKPVIWIYPGNPRYMPGVSTPVDSTVILHACIAALADEDVQVVLTTGHHALPKEVLPLPANFRHEPYVPGLAMAKRSDLLIHHGGYGSCQTGLYMGTPAVIIPTFSERESNARRVAALGAGDLIVPTADAPGKKKHVPVEEVRTKVRRVLSDPSFTINARRISEKMQTCGGATQAARLIENFGQGWSQTQNSHRP